MAKLFVDTNNISSHSCNIIMHFPDGNFTIAGLNSEDDSVCVSNIPDTMPTSPNVIFPDHKSINMRLFNNETHMAINSNLKVAAPEQICVYPNMTFDPNSEAIFNASTHKAIDKHIAICDSHQACEIPEVVNCLSIGGAVGIGIFCGGSFVFLAGVYAYFIGAALIAVYQKCPSYFGNVFDYSNVHPAEHNHELASTELASTDTGTVNI